MASSGHNPIVDLERSPSGRKRTDSLFALICIVAASIAIMVLMVLLLAIGFMGYHYMSLSFLTSPPSSNPNEAGLLPAVVGSLWVCGICALTAIPLGIGSAILLEEYRPQQRHLKRAHNFVQTNISNLAGVPSIVYGILGLTAFAQMFGGLGVSENFSIGQRWYHQYVDAGGLSYFTRAASKDAPVIPAFEGMTLFTDTDLKTPAQIEFVAPDELGPIAADIRSASNAVETIIRDGIDQTRGSRARGPAVIDQATAEQIADDAINAAKQVYTTDIASQRDELVQQLLALNGQESGVLRAARSQLIDTLLLPERQARLKGKMEIGTSPLVVDRKAWYYLTVPFGRGVLTGGLTLMLVVLPVIVVAAQESLRAVPQSLRHGALALGSTKWQSVSKIALPAAIPGICTGTILAMSRAIGEAAPVLVLAGIVFIRSTPQNLMDDFTVMPLQIYNWTGRPQDEFRQLAATGIIVLLTILLTFNAIAIYIRQRTQKQY